MSFIRKAACVAVLTINVMTLSYAVETQIQRATPFYLNPTSPLSSGQARRAELEKNVLTKTYQPSYEISVNSQVASVSANALLRDLDLSTEAVTREAKNPVFTLPRVDKKSTSGLRELPRDRRVHILLKEGEWVLVRIGSSTKLWMLETYLRTYQKETGCFRSLQKGFLRKEASLTSPIIVDLPKSLCLVPDRYAADWIHVTYDGVSGWINSTQLIHKTDVAQWVYWKGKWNRVIGRKGTLVATDKGIQIPLSEIESVITDPSKGFVLQLENIQAGTPIKVLSRNDVLWIQSKIPDHGIVWWKRLDMHPLDERAPEKITTEQLLRREIFSADFDQDKSRRGIVSASGIYVTRDGETWTKINQFKNENHPVSLHPMGYLVVGDQYSRNDGRSFAPYVRWDTITKLIELHTQKSANQIILHEVKSQPNAGLKLTLHTGTEKITVKGFINENNWEISK